MTLDRSHRMSQKITSSDDFQLPVNTRRRIPEIIKGLLVGETHEQIGERCGVRRETISRDIKKWRRSGGFDDWVESEFFRLHGLVNDDPISSETAYRVLARLKERMMALKIEGDVAVSGGIEYKITFVDKVKGERVEVNKDE